jgi:hypothetical protein
MMLFEPTIVNEVCLQAQYIEGGKKKGNSIGSRLQNIQILGRVERRWEKENNSYSLP